MDNQRDEAFEESYSNICKPIIARPYPRKENGEYVYKEIHEAYLMWQAKAQAVPGGFVLVPKEPTQEIYRTFYDAFNSANAGNTAQCFKVAYKAMIKAQEQSHDGF